MKTKIKLFDIYVFLITLFKGFGAESNNKGYVLAFVIGCIAIVTKMARERYTTKELMAVLSIFLIGMDILHCCIKGEYWRLSGSVIIL